MIDPTVAPGTDGLSEADLPELYHAADTASVGAQRIFIFSTLARLVLLVIAAAGVVFDEIFHTTEAAIGAIIAAVAFMAAILVEAFLLQSDADRIWYEGRAAAETAKSLAWRYAVGGEPFGIGKDEAGVDQAFLSALQVTLQDLTEVPLAASLGGAHQISPRMRELRAAPIEVRQAAYHEARVEDQRRWYAAKRAVNARRANLFAILTLGAEVLGGIAAVARATRRVDANLYHIAAPIAVAIASWAQTKQYRNLANAYGIAALELASIAALTLAPRSEQEWARFVDESETAISREHRLWRATRGHRKHHAEVTGAI